MKRSKCSFLSVALCFFPLIFSTRSTWALSIDEVMIEDSEVQDVCTPLKGEHPVSIQPGVQFRMAGEGEAGITLYGAPKRKQFQSFSCGETKATIYYYQFGSREELERRLDGIKAILWGESGPTKLHPELVLNMDNVLVVVSSRHPEFFAALLSHRVAFPDLEDSALEDRLRTLRCGSGKESSAELCSTLRDLKNGTTPDEIRGKEILLLGKSWEVSKDGGVGKETFEVLYMGQLAGVGTVASFGRIEPDNDNERTQILAQMEAQKTGKNADTAGPLLQFARDAFGKTKARARKVGERSLAFIGMGNRIYLRSSGNRLILATDLMYPVKEQPFVVAAFNVARAGPSAPPSSSP